MLVNIEQRRAEIDNFNGCSLHSIVKLHLNLFNLLFNIFLVCFFITAMTVCYITEFQIFLCITTLFLCDFLPLLSTFISYSNFSHFWLLESFTNYLYISSFVVVIYFTYFLHILLLQQRDVETNPGPQKKKIKNLSCCHWNVTSLIAHTLSKVS